MLKALPKIIVATLFGIVFWLGGVEVASAAPPPSALDQAKNLFGSLKCESWGCLTELPTLIFVYLSYFLYILSAGILALAGYIFDAVLTLSIDRTFINKDFVGSTWIILRDFSNMAFIFVLLYTGIQTMLGMGNWRKTVIQVIVIALLINFSLFFTKVVIDAGNILAVGIYEAMGTVKIDKTHTKPAVGGIVERDLSSVLTAKFGPQTILKEVGKTTNSPFLVFAVFMLGGVVNILAAWAFFRVALMFIGRIIGFWFLMIVSPFAFISTTFPKGNVFQKWLDNLLGLSFVAPVFLFFLYLIMQVLTTGNITSTLGKPSASSLAEFSFDVIFVPVIMVIFIYMALDKAVSVSKDMAGGFGKLGSDMGGAIMGAAAAGAAVTGVGAVSALSSVGGKFAGRGGVLGAIGDASAKVGHAGRNLTFDARNIPIPLAGGTLGSHTGTGTGRAGTFATSKDEAVKHAEEKAKRAAEKPESIEQALAKAAAKRREDQALKDATAAQMTPDEVADMELREARNEAERIDKADTATKEAEKEVRAATEAERVAKEAHDESETAKIIKALQEGFTKASKAGNVGEATKLAESLKAAKEAHATSETGLKLEAAKVTLKKSTENYTEAVKSRAEAEKHTATLIEEENKNRANVHAREAEARGRYDTAAKIRKGEKGGKKTAKELVEELMKETGEKVEEPKK